MLRTGIKSDTGLRYEVLVMLCTVDWEWRAWWHCPTTLVCCTWIIVIEYCYCQHRGDNDVLHNTRESVQNTVNRNLLNTMQHVEPLRQWRFGARGPQPAHPGRANSHGSL